MKGFFPSFVNLYILNVTPAATYRITFSCSSSKDQRMSFGASASLICVLREQNRLILLLPPLPLPPLPPQHLYFDKLH